MASQLGRVVALGCHTSPLPVRLLSRSAALSFRRWRGPKRSLNWTLYGGMRQAQFDYSECFLNSVAYKPKYRLPLVMRALRAYSCLPIERENHISASFEFDRTRDSNQKNFSGNAIFPHTWGKPMPVGVFADGMMAEEAEKVGARVIQSEKIDTYFERIKHGEERLLWMYLATPETMRQLKKFGSTLKDLTPTAKKGLVFTDPAKLCEKITSVQNVKQYTVTKKGTVSIPIGRVTDTDEMIYDNLKYFVEAVAKEMNGRHKKLRKSFQLVKSIRLCTKYGRTYLLSFAECHRISKGISNQDLMVKDSSDSE